MGNLNTNNNTNAGAGTNDAWAKFSEAFPADMAALSAIGTAFLTVALLGNADNMSLGEFLYKAAPAWIFTGVWLAATFLSDESQDEFLGNE
jgi:hypothetical protein